MRPDFANYFFHSEFKNYLINNYDNTIYELEDTLVEGLYKFDFLNYNLPSGKHWKSNDIDLENYANVNMCYQTKQILYLKYNFTNKLTIQAFINKINNRIVKFSPDKKFNNTKESLFWGKMLGTYKDYFIFYKDPYTFNNYNKNDKEMNLLLKKFNLFDIKSTDNPILFFIKLKNF